MAPLDGKTLGPYRIIERIGRGGMATVYKAYHAAMNREVAIKILPEEYATEDDFRTRFEREAQVVANLRHPFILPVFDYGEEDGIAYLVMPYIPTGTLKKYLHDHAPLDYDSIIRIMGYFADALDYAHKQGIIHRDIKPDNVLFDENGIPLLTDFGLTRMMEGGGSLTGTGVIGTPAYMSPEQGQGKAIDHRSDIYSMGIILYEMVTGNVPFDADTPVAIIFKHVADPLPMPRDTRPDLSDKTQQVILKALAKEPEDRWDSCRAMIDAFAQAVRDIPAPPVEIPADDDDVQDGTMLGIQPKPTPLPDTSTQFIGKDEDKHNEAHNMASNVPQETVPSQPVDMPVDAPLPAPTPTPPATPDAQEAPPPSEYVAPAFQKGSQPMPAVSPLSKKKGMKGLGMGLAIGGALGCGLLVVLVLVVGSFLNRPTVDDEATAIAQQSTLIAQSTTDAVSTRQAGQTAFEATSDAIETLNAASAVLAEATRRVLNDQATANVESSLTAEVQATPIPLVPSAIQPPTQDASAINNTATAIAELLAPTATATSLPTDTPIPTATHTATPTATNTPIPTATNTPTPEPKPIVRNITGDTLNVRDGAGTGFAVVASLSPNQYVEAIGQNADGSWYEVRIDDETTGWVAEFLVETVEGGFRDLASSFTGTRNDDWQPVEYVIDGVPMVLVPVGCFTMGSTEEEIDEIVEAYDVSRSSLEDELSAHDQCVTEPYWIDKYEAMNGVINEVNGVINAGVFDCNGYSREPDEPDICQRWRSAKDDCEARGGMLPNEVQWEYAARGVESWIYPWGNTFNRNNVIFGENIQTGPDGFLIGDGTFPVGSRPNGASWVGAQDMAGNVAEWTRSERYDYPYVADDGREDGDFTDDNFYIMIRGGSWASGPAYVRSASRSIEALSEDRNYRLGFRCVRPVD
jgi:serine/threonine protein kinase/formylglycine-generating enzyme required for sulfatase activity